MTKGGKAKRKGYSTLDILLGTAPKPSNNGQRNSKKINKSKNHHDTLKGNRRSRGWRNTTPHPKSIRFSDGAALLFRSN